MSSDICIVSAGKSMFDVASGGKESERYRRLTSQRA
jgi:hypothetical protein